MKPWQLYKTAQVVEEIGSKKLAAFHAARMAGILVPEDAVLMPVAVPGEMYWSDQDQRVLQTLAASGEGKVVIRDLGLASSLAHRAIITNSDKFFFVVGSLVADQSEPTPLYVQACWPGENRETSRKVTVTLAGESKRSPFIAGYETTPAGIVSPFRSNDPHWSAVCQVCNDLWDTLGICAQVVLGLVDDTIAVLSIRGSFLPASKQIRTTLAQMELRTEGHGNTIVAISEAVETQGNQYRLEKSDTSPMELKGRSVGESWASGRISFTSSTHSEILAAGDPVIMVRPSLRAEDCELFRTASGVVSVTDGISSHYALLASSLQRPCLVDLAGAQIQTDPRALESKGLLLKDGDWATIDENRGTLFSGRAASFEKEVDMPPSVVKWARTLREASVYANCEDPESATASIALGADGIGLCRSERHLVRSQVGLEALRNIVASTDGQSSAEAAKILFKELGTALEHLLEAVHGRPIAYRLLEPAEILLDGNQSSSDPSSDALGDSSRPSTQVMLRGATFRNQFPFLFEGQIRAALQAAAKVSSRGTFPVDLAIIVPMVSDVEEYRHWYRLIKRIAARIESSSQATINISAGPMIETPRATVLAGQLAHHSDVFLFGTNDLTALVWGLDRFGGVQTPSGTFDPFARFDANGVGQLICRAIRDAREVNPILKVSVCGSHASVTKDTDAILDTGADSLSCQPGTIVPIAVQMTKRAERLKGHLHFGLPEKPSAVKRSKLAFAAVAENQLGCHTEPDNHDFRVLSDWAREISEDLSLNWTGIWKFFKRDLTSRSFGQREARRFLPGWRSEEALDYALFLSSNFDSRIRYSVFPAEIACRATSEVFPLSATPETWRAVLDNLDQQVAVEIFPQQPVNRTAFRAVLRDMNLSIEGAPGQAIDIFWKAPQELSKFAFDGCSGVVSDLTGADSFKELFDSHLENLFTQSQALRDYLGVDWISLEGYAGPEADNPLFIADLDLPLDGVLITNVGGD